MAGHEGPVTSVSFSPVWSASGVWSHDRTVRLWDAESCQAVGALMAGIRVGSRVYPSARMVGKWYLGAGIRRCVCGIAESCQAVGAPMRGIRVGLRVCPSARMVGT